LLNNNITTLISVCHPKHLEIWEIASKNIVKYISADNYIVVVPDYSLQEFVSHTDPRFQIISENEFIKNFDLEKIRAKVKDKRINWYLQQFIKLEFLSRLKFDERVILWDADTIPLKQLEFFDQLGNPIFYSSSEYHPPYFEAIKKLLGMDKVVAKSFIAQCFPITYEIVINFFSHIEKYNLKSWHDAVIDCIDPHQTSGFSEYESLGTFITNQYSYNVNWNESSWSRLGYEELKKVGLELVEDEQFYKLSNQFDYLSFEKWETDLKTKKKHISFSNISRNLKKMISKIYKYFNKSKHNCINETIEKIIDTENNLLIVQIGANDGIQNDPLRRHFLKPGNYTAILIEPLPFFVYSLKKLYNKRDDIKIIQAAAGQFNENRLLYYIPNHIAFMMNGDGPQNNWALGQGSFSKENVVYWIKNNSFRGDEYKKNIQFWIENIVEINVPVLETQNLLLKSSKNILLVIDVQGFELDVLKGIDWNFPPKYIMIEEDLNDRSAREYLISKGYDLFTFSNSNLLFLFPNFKIL
jgi:FkbM family methyltransferase